MSQVISFEQILILQYFQELQAKIIAEIDAATALSTKYQQLLSQIDDIDRQLNDVINIPINTVNEAEKKRSQLEAIRANLNELRSALDHLQESIDRPLEFVVSHPSPVDVDGLIAHHRHLLDTIEQTESELQLRSRIVALEPEMSRLSIQLQEQLNDTDQPATIDDHQRKLEELELRKHQLEDMLKNIPEGTEEGERMREKCKWQLSQLGEWLKKIGNAIGDKLAALAAFNAKKKNIDQHIAHIREKTTDYNDDESSHRTTEQWASALDERNATGRQLAELLNGVDEMLAHGDDLPDDARTEAHQLRQLLLDLIQANEVCSCCCC